MQRAGSPAAAEKSNTCSSTEERQPCRQPLATWILLHAAKPLACLQFRRRLNAPDGGIIASVGAGSGAANNSYGSDSGSGHGGSQPGSPSTPSWQVRDGSIRNCSVYCSCS